MAKPPSSANSILAPGDQLRLAFGISVQRQCLVDEANGARHQLHPLASSAIALLVRQHDAQAWQKQLTAHGATSGQISEILAFLAGIGALVITRTPRAAIRHWISTQYGRVFGIPVQTIARRWPASPAGILAACSLALWPLLLALPVVGLLWVAAGLPASHAAIIVLSSMITLWISVVVHESSHCLPVARHQPHMAIIQSGLRLGILHRPLPPRTDLISALAGPTAGAVVAIILAPGPVGTILAVFHLASLLPFSSDGRAVMSSLPRGRA